MHYLDHAATTPMLPEAVDALVAALGTGDAVGNASSLHAAGRRARRVVEESRETLAKSVGARPSELIFTAGGTESDNLAVKGLYWARHEADAARTRILASGIEHHAVLDTVLWLVEHAGAKVTWIQADADGRVSPQALIEAIAGTPDDIALATIMWANNEVGTVQPIAGLHAVLEPHGIPLHTDAVQAFGTIPLDFEASGVEAMTITAHKLGGPTGVGALVLRRGVECMPLVHGGGQERDVRSGTLDVAAIAGFAAAAEVAVRERDATAQRVRTLRNRLVDGIAAVVPDVVVHGDRTDDGGLPGIAHLSFPGCDGDALLLLLDAADIACSTGAACSAGVPRPSHVLLAMGLSETEAKASLRFSLGHTSSDADVDAVIAAIGPAVERAKAAGSR